MKKIAARGIRALGSTLQPLLPLPLRKQIAILAGKGRLPGQLHFTTGLLDDFARADPNGFHRFLWSNHVAYAAGYEVSNRFRMPPGPDRLLLLHEITKCLRDQGIDPRRKIHSVFDVGCSLGYLLRYAENRVFTSASILRGLDIDRYATETGNNFLRLLGSNIMLTAADMTEADRVFGDTQYDVVLSCGVLMYLEESAAERVVDTMLAHTRYALGLITLAHPAMDNSRLLASGTRASDGSFTHNLDRMIRRSGGRIVYSHWEKPRTLAESAAYTIIACPVRVPDSTKLLPSEILTANGDNS